MVVEDELIVAEDLVHWLTSLGYVVGARATTGQEAIRLCETTRPDLILMDILLSGDMDGIQAAEVIKERYDTPVVYITASSDENTLTRAKVTEPFGYVLKPFDERGLYTTIEMALYKHQSEKRLRNSEERFRLLYEHAPVAFQSLDADAHILQVNRAWQNLFGYTAEEVNGRWFGEFLAPDSVPPFIAAFTAFRTGPVTDSISLTIVRRNGTRIPATFKGSVAVDHRGGFEMTQCVLESPVPWGEQKSVLLPDHISAQEGDTSTRSLQGFWLVVSPDGFILGITPGLDTLLGMSVDRICSLRIHDICVTEDAASTLMNRLTTSGRLDSRSLKLRRGDGEAIAVVVSGFLLQGHGAFAGNSCLQILQR